MSVRAAQCSLRVCLGLVFKVLLLSSANPLDQRELKGCVNLRGA